MSGENILIVEDEGLIALHLSELLEKAGYRIAGTVYSGESVLGRSESRSSPISS